MPFMITAYSELTKRLSRLGTNSLCTWPESLSGLKPSPFKTVVAAIFSQRCIGVSYLFGPPYNKWGRVGPFSAPLH